MGTRVPGGTTRRSQGTRRAHRGTRRGLRRSHGRSPDLAATGHHNPQAQATRIRPAAGRAARAPSLGWAGASAIDFVYTLVRWLSRGAAKGIRHQTLVALTDKLRSTVMPIRSEIAVLAIRLSMTGDKNIQAATIRLSDAAGALLEDAAEPDPQYHERQEELRQNWATPPCSRRLRCSPWQRRRLRGRILAGTAPPSGLSADSAIQPVSGER